VLPLRLYSETSFRQEFFSETQLTLRAKRGKQPFEVATVLRTDGCGDSACPSCVEYLGRRNPERFPTFEEFEAAKHRFPMPIWANADDLDDLDPWWEFTNEVMHIERE
jgi:hypothetical protein